MERPKDKREQKQELADNIMKISNFVSWIKSEYFHEAIAKTYDIPIESIEKFLSAVKDLQSFLQAKTNKSLPKDLQRLVSS